MGISTCYAPTDDKDEKVKDKFYDDLEKLIRGVPGRDFLIVLGTSMPEWDVTARPGRVSLEGMA